MDQIIDIWKKADLLDLLESVGGMGNLAQLIKSWAYKAQPGDIREGVEWERKGRDILSDLPGGTGYLLRRSRSK